MANIRQQILAGDIEAEKRNHKGAPLVITDEDRERRAVWREQRLARDKAAMEAKVKAEAKARKRKLDGMNRADQARALRLEKYHKTAEEVRKMTGERRNTVRGLDEDAPAAPIETEPEAPEPAPEPEPVAEAPASESNDPEWLRAHWKTQVKLAQESGYQGDDAKGARDHLDRIERLKGE